MGGCSRPPVLKDLLMPQITIKQWTSNDENNNKIIKEALSSQKDIKKNSLMNKRSVKKTHFMDRLLDVVPICKNKTNGYKSSEYFTEITCRKCKNIINAIFKNKT